MFSLGCRRLLSCAAASSFLACGLAPEICERLAQQGIARPTHVQRKVLYVQCHVLIVDGQYAIIYYTRVINNYYSLTICKNIHDRERQKIIAYVDRAWAPYWRAGMWW